MALAASKHGQDLDLEGRGAIRQGMVEIEQHRIALDIDFAHQCGQQTRLAIGTDGQAHAHHVPNLRLRAGILPCSIHALAGHPAQQTRDARAEGCARWQIERAVRALVEPDEQGFERRAELSLAERQGSRRATEGVDRIDAARITETVMQGEIGVGLNARHDDGRAGKIVR